jgi:hypothetical protein
LLSESESDPVLRDRHVIASVVQVEAQGQGREEGRRRRRGRHRGIEGDADREGVDLMDDDEGKGGGALWLHPARHHHRHELQSQALRLPGHLPRLIVSPRRGPDAVGSSAFIVVCS